MHDPVVALALSHREPSLNCIFKRHNKKENSNAKLYLVIDVVRCIDRFGMCMREAKDSKHSYSYGEEAVRDSVLC